MALISLTQKEVQTRVIRAGTISSRKGITLSPSGFRIEAFSLKDASIIMATRRSGVRYEISYVKDAAEMQIYRALLGPSEYLIAKLERLSSMLEPDQIAKYANELWVCRGDLGAELGLLTLAQKTYEFSKSIASIPVPVYLASQVLEHMTNYPDPTRSEICYLYSALADGFKGLVLSDETAIGRYPVESCKTAALFKTS